MNEKEGLLRVGKYNPKFNEILGINIKDYEIYRSKGLLKSQGDCIVEELRYSLLTMR